MEEMVTIPKAQLDALEDVVWAAESLVAVPSCREEQLVEALAKLKEVWL